jgi:hypothetical protein
MRVWKSFQQPTVRDLLRSTNDETAVRLAPERGTVLDGAYRACDTD